MGGKVCYNISSRVMGKPYHGGSTNWQLMDGSKTLSTFFYSVLVIILGISAFFVTWKWLLVIALGVSLLAALIFIMAVFMMKCVSDHEDTPEKRYSWKEACEGLFLVLRALFTGVQFWFTDNFDWFKKK